MGAWSNEEWIERAREGRLDPRERGEFDRLLAASPELSEMWELERRLDQALGMIQPIEPSSNFTARVLAEAQRLGPTGRVASRIKKPLWISWWRPVAGMAACGLVVAVWMLQEQRRRTETALDLSAMTSVASALTPPETSIAQRHVVLEDFETIHRMAHASVDSVADAELLAVLQTR